VTAEVAVALAGAYRPSLLLLGRSPAPKPEPDWLAPLRDEAEIKRALAARANGQATPQLIGEQFRATAANREVLRTLTRIEQAGARAVYRAVDVRDPRAVAEAVGSVRGVFGPVRGLIHGAGVLADRKIEDQTDAQFADVFATKVAGLRALLDAASDDDLRLLVLFSSSTARFGRAGQVAYAAANEALNKIARREASRRPGCKVVAVNWGPWDGGMVTPSLKPLFASEGIGLIPLAVGARYLLDEIQSNDAEAVEVVVLGPGSVAALTLPSAVSSVPSDPLPAVPSEPSPDSTGPASATPAGGLSVVFERPFDLDEMPVLRSHVIDGRAVLPMALTLEFLAQGALQRHPGLTFRGVDDLRLLKGAVLHDGRPETLAVLVGKATRDGEGYRVPVELRGTLDGGKVVSHARGSVVLADGPSQPGPRRAEPAGLAADLRTPRVLYHDLLFHGPDFQAIERIEASGEAGITATVRTAPSPSGWLDRPLRQSWLSDPLAIDAAFQLLTVWSIDRSGSPALPTVVGSYRQFVRSFPAEGVRIVASARRPSPLHVVSDVEWLGADGSVVARLEGYECVANPSLVQAFRRNRLAPSRVVGRAR
jgi:hypothetical protein